MRSISRSACFISSIDSLVLVLAEPSRPQFFSIRACRKYWLIAVSSLLEDLVEVLDDVDVAAHGGPPGSWRGRGGRRLTQPEGRALGIKLSAIEDFAGAGLAGAAARRHAGARLQLLEGPHAFVDRLLQSGLGDAVADADVHGCTSLERIIG